VKAITVENLSKIYSIATAQDQGASFREMLTEQAHSFFKKGPKQEPFYALKDVSFEVEQGEVLGVIGKNGSGKSTLLKILSKITAPTSGRAIVRGRVASLLEVGTGFHAELTGRENIFMSGIILGMKRWEIIKHFDEIVSFAGVEKFLDIPVKKYSSGMRLRLAFSVAAHLQPEILLIDEVLAVGDYEFEKKCLKVIKGISNTGRTILFVSHNMSTVSRLCSRVMHFSKGELVQSGSPQGVIESYLGLARKSVWEVSWEEDKEDSDLFKINNLCVINSSLKEAGFIDSKEAVRISVEYSVKKPNTRISLILSFYTEKKELIFIAFESLADGVGGYTRKPGQYKSECTVPGHIFNDGIISVTLEVSNPGIQGKILETNSVLSLNSIISFKIKNLYRKKVEAFIWKNEGVVSPHIEWKVQKRSFL
jgi:lipopolysaccharide transport system ATP-binding protein